MADVTISSLPLGTPSGNALIPFSIGSATYQSSISSLTEGTNTSGVWTPYIDSRTGIGSPTISYTINQGKYLKIGKFVHLYGWLRGTVSSKGGTTEQLCVFGLPFDLPSTYNDIACLAIGNVTGWTSCPRSAVVYGSQADAPSAALNTAKIILRKYSGSSIVNAELVDMVLGDLPSSGSFDIQLGGTVVIK